MFAFFPQTFLLPESTAFAEQAPAQCISLIHSENRFLAQAFLAAHHPNPQCVGSFMFSLLALLAFLRGKARNSCQMFSNLLMELLSPTYSSCHSLLPADGRMLFPTTNFQASSQNQHHSKHPWEQAEHRRDAGNDLSCHKTTSDWVCVCTAVGSRVLWFYGSEDLNRLFGSF